MTTLLEQFNQTQLKKDLPDIRPGDTIRVYQKTKEGDKGKIQIFEGVVIAKKHGRGTSSTITVRKIISGVGVERIFPLHSPAISKIEISKKGEVRRSKLYYLRTAEGRRLRVKRKDEFSEAIAPAVPETIEETSSENPEQS